MGFLGFGGGSLTGSDGKTASERSQHTSGLGLTTGTTWHGNTAYGPAGGMAAGYATRASDGSLSNFRSMGNEPMSGAYGRVTGPAPPSGHQGGNGFRGGWNPAAGFQSALGAAASRFGGQFASNPFSALRGLLGLGHPGRSSLNSYTE